ncbi:hypothetical protein HMPREF3229_01709 [Peptoniphilus harei]|uniref:Uncharacterized protein n=1 Tax=Peptoniphilus harei TaxID=54005 RepID=A0A133PJQ2_9FIRM|nr:hypothetical protein [Peptoniphilus harei]KXA28713.1 hypothetical protein HMPREF3229_01709 [Peptoniphilus harei]
MFDEKLFLEIAKEMGAEVIDGPGLDMVNGVEVDVMDLIFGEFGLLNTDQYVERETISIDSSEGQYNFNSSEDSLSIGKDNSNKDKTSINFENCFAA